MSKPIGDMRTGAHEGAQALLARTAAADAVAHRALGTAIADFALPDTDRLDERTRASLARLLHGLITVIESEVGGHAVRLLRAQGEAVLADMLAGQHGVAGRLHASGVLHDPALMGELIARVRQDLLAGGMAAQAQDEPERASLLNRLAQHPDRLLAQSAAAVLVNESRRRSMPDATGHSDLPAELHYKLVWQVAAALRAGFSGNAPALDRALADSAQRSLAAHDENDRLEAAAMRLAVAIDARPDELPELLAEALGDRRVALFAAVLAHALRIDFDAVRAMTLDSASERLWVALRALDFDRAAVARLGVALSEADPRRDVEAFADQLDTIMAVGADEARAAIAPLALPADYRAALLALKGAPQ
ncbi:DUF2336 domain-containing protein [Sphingomonas koreensis]|jgi:hypothetical protein|uniref:DUF2336 domain-containing protein n=2 Tax=Sphingomonas koreensis TaxID=93064 RepID=A0AAJ4S281_9SPHN|nr:DUF2336 domain-containing protein [Sphingomonas koreensis]RSU19222.1 DUF2336 domain-containing protein [Sphingomonas koreensis]RSU28454.1 DUF2336 domain-containing protein [Sphingomonas koreensis]RSU31224.1 DUF2336 domain-containing protein [Sphingomonas koreensis]RSU38057.1 DUF2336 domain-containing protein [Sphingomonas koreensis]RSU40121.1 DUF2336 domain-containing protein [Sphingomonas koreensis]